MKKVVFTFGRFNPITVGHGKLIEKVIKLADGSDHRIYASHTEDNSKNPLPYERKVSYLRKLFPQANITTDPKAVTVYAICRILSDQGYKDVTLVVGGDRISDFEKVRSYIRRETDKDFDPTKHYLFEKFNIVSAGERTGKDTIAAASGTKMREYARANDFDSFLRDTPTKNVALARDMFRDVQKKLVKEDLVDLAEGVNDHGIFKAVFLAGGPGSGKDFIAAKLLGGTGLVELNSDVAFEMLMKKNNIPMIMDKEDSQRDAARGKAKTITRERERLFFSQRKGVMINGTADDREKLTRIKHELEAIGYDTAMIFVNTTEDVAKQRNLERGQRGGRTVPDNIAKEKWLDAQKNIGYYQHVFNPFLVVDNSTDLRSLPPEQKKEIDARFNRMYKQFRAFIAGPIHRKEAQDWIKKELSKRDIQQYAGVPKAGSFGKSRPNQMEDRTDENYINTLKEEFSKLDTLSIGQYSKIRNVLKTLDEETLQLFADSDIKFVSHLARNRIR